MTARANGHEAKSGLGEASGLAVKGNRDEMAELNRFLDERFQRLAVIEKIRILLDRAACEGPTVALSDSHQST